MAKSKTKTKKKKKSINNLSSSGSKKSEERITIVLSRLGDSQKRILRQLYDGPVVVRITEAQKYWRRERDEDANIAAMEGCSDFHLYPWAFFIEDYIPMTTRKEAQTENDDDEEITVVQIPDKERVYLYKSFVTLWDRGLVEAFSREVEKVNGGYRRIPMKFYQFNGNQRERNSRIFGITLRTEGLIACRYMFEDIWPPHNVSFV